MQMLIEFPKQRVDIKLEELDDWMTVYCAGDRLISLPTRLDPMSSCAVTIDNIVYPNMMAAYWGLLCKHDEDRLKFGIPLEDARHDPKSVSTMWDFGQNNYIIDLAFDSDIEFNDDKDMYSQTFDTVFREACGQNEDVLNELLETYPYPIIPCVTVYDPNVDKYTEAFNDLLKIFTAVMINVRADLVQNDHINADKYVSRGADDREREHIHDWVFNKPWHTTFEEYKDSILPRSEAERQLKDYIEIAKERNTTVTTGEVELNWLASHIISKTMCFYDDVRLDKTTFKYLNAFAGNAVSLEDIHFNEETVTWEIGKKQD